MILVSFHPSRVVASLWRHHALWLQTSIKLTEKRSKNQPRNLEMENYQYKASID